ncbi:unnamed protein product, partial [Candidula unifasciata]
VPNATMAVPIPEGSKTPYVFLGKSGLKVSNITLGTMTFGENQFGRPGNTDEAQSHEIINRYVEWGGNFLDTADVYGMGISESIVGRWLETQPRDKFVIATKCRFDVGTENNINNVGLSRRHITESIDRSLQRLHTDFVDLYQFVWAKVRYIGASNVTGWQLQKLVGIVDRLGLNPIVSLQQQYNLVIRESELESFQVCKNEGIGVLPWSPLKGGLLAGKVKRGQKPTEGRMSWVAADESKEMQSAPNWKKLDDKTFDLLEALEAIAKKHAKSVPQVAIRWLLQKDVVSSVIIGARTLAQLDDNMGANGWSLTLEE